METESINIEVIGWSIFWIVLIVAFLYFGYWNDFKNRKRESVYNVTVLIVIGVLFFVQRNFYLVVLRCFLASTLDLEFSNI